jgi:outer membrane protein assembly factor BamA
MKTLFVGLSLVCLATVCSTTAPGAPPARAAAPRIGPIFILGNEITRQDVILDAVGLYPGQLLRAADLWAAEKNLERLGLFVVDRARGVRPTVVVLQGGDEFRDVLVSVQEKHTTSLRLRPGINARGEPAISLVLVERNFDPAYFPPSLDDLLSGRSFRGAGQTLRLELIQMPLLPFGMPSMSLTGSYVIPARRFVTSSPGS